MKKFKCPCGYIYDPDKGCEQNKIIPGTSFHDLPEDWICPYCGYEKDYFKGMDTDELVKGLI